jgi:hypothetical protein
MEFPLTCLFAELYQKHPINGSDIGRALSKADPVAPLSTGKKSGVVD